VSSLATKPAVASGEFAIGGDLIVTRLGYGAMQIPGPGVWGEPRDRDEVIRVLRRAVEMGVTFIDTADTYGPEVSERIIREALHPYPAELVIATKAGMTRSGPDRWGRNGQPEHLRAQAEKSLRLLGLERIELFQLHRIDPDVPLADQLGVLVELQAEGKIGHIGLSEVSVAEIEAAQAIAPIARARVVATALTGPAADTGHLDGCAPRREPRRGPDRAHCRSGRTTRRRDLTAGKRRSTHGLPRCPHPQKTARSRTWSRCPSAISPSTESTSVSRRATEPTRRR
jgi:Aldo/keto reductase family